MNDVFISYAHIDDLPLSEGHRGWISQFHRTLEVRLAQLLGQDLKIWRDPKLQGADVFDEAIVNQFTQSKVMISVLSPRYVKSEWCMREAQEFFEHAQGAGGIRVNDKSRIFKVVKTPVLAEELRPPLDSLFQSLLGYEFYDLDQDTGRVREFHEAFGPAAKQSFFEKVYDVAYEVCQVLRSCDTQNPAASTEKTKAGKTVYLAVTSSELIGERDRLRRELLERGHTVLPDRTLPLVGPDLAVAVRELLGRCQLAVHLVGDRYGLIPEESDCSVVELQNRLAAERSGQERLERLIWLPKTLAPRDERQAAFVRQLIENPEVQRGAEVIQDTLENFKGLLLEKLAPSTAPSAALAVPASSRAVPAGPQQIYLICDQRDETAIEPLEDYLFDQGFEVMTPHREGGEGTVSRLHRERLLHCDAVMIYYGAGSRSWVEMKLMDLLQAPGYGRAKPMLAQAVYVAPPEDRKKERFRTHLAEVIHQRDHFIPGVLDQFVSQILTARTK